MNKLSINAKMMLLTALFAVGLGSFVVTIFVTTADTVEDSEYHNVILSKDLVADVLPPPMYVVEAWAVANELAHGVDKTRATELRDSFRTLERDKRARRDFWMQHVETNSPRAAMLNEVDHTADNFFATANTQFLPAVDTGDPARVRAALGTLGDVYRKQRDAVSKLVTATNQQIDRDVQEAAGVVRARKLRSGLAGTLIALLGAGFGLYIARDVRARMKSAVQLLERVAHGDLTARMDVTSGDEIGTMARALNEAFDAVHQALMRVQSVAGSLASTAAELSGSAEEISAGAQQQASSLEETAASLEQITATVRQSAGNAQQASQLAEQSRDVATQGGTVVHEAVGAMNEVTRSSRRIGDIITTIDEIALQTNLLALNAAVEAARAGEQGRGFAVVAAEVGSLAQRSAAAAKEVKTLIEDTLERVETGHSLVGRSGQALSEIITSVKRVTDIVGEIASASREQSAGVEQVNQAVTQMDQVTQSNASQTDALSQTASDLASTAGELQQLVGRFRLGSAEPEPTPKEPPATRRRAEGPARRGFTRPPRLPTRGPAFGRSAPLSPRDSADDADDIELV